MPQKTPSLALILLFAWALSAQPAVAQERSSNPKNRPAEPPERIALFLDCDFCDRTFIRQELTYLDHVRDREVADVHVLITRARTGSGGFAYHLELIGRRGFGGQSHTTGFTTAVGATDAEVRDELLRALEIALVPALMQTPLRNRLRLHVTPAADAETGIAARTNPRNSSRNPSRTDPWNSWIIEMYADGNADIESNQRSFNSRYGIYVSRVTEDWKLQFRPFFNYNYDRFDQADGIIESTSRRDGFTSYAVKSFSPHWSAGAFGDVLTSTFSNVDWRYRAMAALEWSYFPYREATRRQLTVTYRIGASHVTYRDTTIFNRMEELLPQHLLNTDFQLVQPWGDLFLGVNASQYLHEPSHYSLQFFTSIGVRITQGLSVEVGGSYERIQDQINLAKGGADLQEVLLRRRQLATAYEAGVRFGFRYRFGSTLNNVVNTRMNRVGSRDRF